MSGGSDGIENLIACGRVSMVVTTEVSHWFT